MEKRIKLDYRNKTITEPCVYKPNSYEQSPCPISEKKSCAYTGKIIFGEVLCQYATFENEVRFEKCIFEEDVVFGDEFNDEAFCTIKADLIFDGCIFKKKVKLDGLQCAGHVIFKGGCDFEYGDEDEHYDYVLSMSNATIGLGVFIQNSFFKSGINLSATHINQVGCQLDNVKLNNSRCDINFCSSYMGKELSIKASNIICLGFNFESVSVDDNQGTIQFKGKYVGSKDDQTIVLEFLESKYGNREMLYDKIISIYRLSDEANSAIVLMKESNETNLDYKALESTLRLAVNIDDSIKIIYCDDSSYDNYGLLPIGSISRITNNEKTVAELSVLYGESIFLVNPESHDMQQLDLTKIAPFIFRGFIEDERTEGLEYEVHDHRSVPMIYARLPSMDESNIWSKDYIAIYDSNHNFKVYKWNYIKCNWAIDLSQTHVGRGLYIRQSELDVPKFDMHALSAQHEIHIEDIVFNIYNIDLSQTRITNIKLFNIDFEYRDTPDNVYINYPEDWIYCGINLDCSHIANNIIMKDITASKYTSFVIRANLMVVEKILILQELLHDYETSMKLDLQNSLINQLYITQSMWDNTFFETNNLTIDGILVGDDLHLPTPEDIINMKGLVGKVKTDEEEPISFLKQVDKIYEKNDNYKKQKEIWKYRNKLRIRRDHKPTARLRILANNLLLNYGWSPWPIVFWLFGMYILFNGVTMLFFDMPFEISLVNGLVEFIPVSFNEPIVQQIHGMVSPNQYMPPIYSFGYSIAVTVYRLLSYTLLSVLIAAFAGYFRKKNQ